MEENQVKKNVVVEEYFYGKNLYCPSCGKHLGFDYSDINDINYCSKCGQPLNMDNIKD